MVQKIFYSLNEIGARNSFLANISTFMSRTPQFAGQSKLYHAAQKPADPGKGDVDQQPLNAPDVSGNWLVHQSSLDSHDITGLAIGFGALVWVWLL